MMKQTNQWDKCMNIIQRISSRVNNEQNQSVMTENWNTVRPLCVDKSFYQYKNDVGQGHCVELCDAKINGQCRDPFITSNIFDKKREYVDYIVTNVLRQVVNHIPFDCLHQLSYCLPQNIESILCHTDMDSDRLIRVLVTDVLRSYSKNAEQLVDWYAFASSIKPLPVSTENDIEKRNKISSQHDEFFQHKKNSEDQSSHPIHTTLTTTSVSPAIKEKQSAHTRISSESRSPVTPMSVHSKEEFTPVGSKYQSKARLHQNVASREESITSQSQHQILLNSSLPAHDHQFDPSSDRSSSSDCVLTIHHTCKHKKAHKHHTITTSFDNSVSHSLISSSPPLPTEESVHKNKPKISHPNAIKTQQLPFKLLASSDNATKYLIEIENPSFQKSLDRATLPTSDDQPLLLHEDRPHKNVTRINHYPNMLADFD